MFKSLTSVGRKLPDVGIPSASLESLPVPMQRAVRLMLAGAAATGVWGLFLIIVILANKNDLFTSSGKKVTSGELTGDVVYSVLVTVILAAVWVLMARMNQSGRNWARITSSVLFVLWSIEAFTPLAGTTAAVLAIVDTVLVLIIWLIGLGALYMLWRPESKAFFRAQSPR